MNRIKKTIFIFLFMILSLIKVSPKMQSAIPMPTQEEIDEILNSPEFKEFAKEFEEALENMDEEDFRPMPREKQKRTETKTKEKSEKPEYLQNRRDNFLAPISAKASKEKGFSSKYSKKQIKLHPKKSLDLEYYTNMLSKNLNEIVAKINGFTWGIAFKEYCEDKGIQTTASNINRINKQIKDQKIIQRVFYNEKHNKLRSSFLKLAEKSKAFASKIKRIKPKEDIHAEEIKELKRLAKGKREEAAKTKKLEIKQTPLQKEIIYFFTNEVANLEKQLQKMLQDPQIKKETEEKIKKREQKVKKAEESIKRSRGRRRDYFGSDRGRWSQGGRRIGGSSGQRWPRSNYGRPSGGYSRYPSYPKSPYRDSKPKISKPSDRIKKSSRPSKYGKDDLSKKHDDELKEKEKEKREELSGIDSAITLLDNTLNLFNEISKSYKEDDPNSWIDILSQNHLSTISKNIDKLEEFQNKLLVKQKTNITQNKIDNTKTDRMMQLTQETETIKNKFNTQLALLNKARKDFVSAGLRLAKYYSENDHSKNESMAAYNIIKKEPEILKAENKKYETKLLNLLLGKEESIGKYETTQKEIRNIFLNLKALNSNPKSDLEKINDLNDEYAIESLTALTEQKNITRVLDKIKNKVLSNKNIDTFLITRSIQSAKLEFDINKAVLKVVGANPIRGRVRSLLNVIINQRQNLRTENLNAERKKALLKEIIKIERNAITKLNLIKKINALVS